MAAKSQKNLARLERRKSVAELAIKGWTQEAIAEQMGISQSTVSADLQHIIEKWNHTCREYAEHARGVELAGLQRIVREANAGWERSQKPTQTAVLDGDAQPNSSKARRTIKNQTGDPRFLDLILRASAQRRALLGIDVSPVDGSSDGPVTPHLQRDKVLSIFDEFRERKRVAESGTELGHVQPGPVRDGNQSGEMETRQASG